MDLTRTRYQTFDDLQTYTYGSASRRRPDDVRTVSASPTPPPCGRAHDLGLAMQLTNFWRDIGEDWRDARPHLPAPGRHGAVRLHRSHAGRGRRQRPVHRPDAVRDRPRPRRFMQSADLGIPYITADCRLPGRSSPASCTPAFWTRSKPTATMSSATAPAPRPGKSRRSPPPALLAFPQPSP